MIIIDFNCNLLSIIDRHILLLVIHIINHHTILHFSFRLLHILLHLIVVIAILLILLRHHFLNIPPIIPITIYLDPLPIPLLGFNFLIINFNNYLFSFLLGSLNSLSFLHLIKMFLQSF